MLRKNRRQDRRRYQLAAFPIGGISGHRHCRGHWITVASFKKCLCKHRRALAVGAATFAIRKQWHAWMEDCFARSPFWVQEALAQPVVFLAFEAGLNWGAVPPGGQGTL